jgi:hypothetical protein
VATLVAAINPIVKTVWPAFKVYRSGEVPADAQLPYAVVHDFIADAMLLTGDAKSLGRSRRFQVDVFFATGAGDEDHDGIESLRDALDGAPVTFGSGRGFTVRVLDVTRRRDPGDTDVHYLYDCQVRYLTEKNTLTL